MGLSLKVVPVPCVHLEAGTQPHSVPCEGKGPCLQQLLVGLGVTEFCRNSNHKRQLCVWVDSQETAALAVCSFPPVRPASSLREASRGSPGPGRISHSCDGSTRVDHAFTCQSLSLSTCPLRTETMAKANPHLLPPLSPPSRGRPGTSGQTLSWLCARQGSRLPGHCVGM